mmetsp:Transcript_84647/g.218163  ORF Transcript_84647/g.218163 Transcript_84647/m.218163 type:complete len:277 (-) Transcript_84647:1134-1964(-)
MLWRANAAASCTNASSGCAGKQAITVSMPPTLAIMLRRSSSKAKLPKVRQPASWTRTASGWRCSAFVTYSTPTLATARRFSGAVVRSCSTQQAFSCTSGDHACLFIACMTALTPPRRATSISMPTPRKIVQRARQACSCTPGDSACVCMAWISASTPPYSMTFDLPSSLQDASLSSMHACSTVSIAAPSRRILLMVDHTPSQVGVQGLPLPALVAAARSMAAEWSSAGTMASRLCPCDASTSSRARPQSCTPPSATCCSMAVATAPTAPSMTTCSA